MGCDIHVFIEKKTDEKYNIWEQVALYRVGKYGRQLETADPYDGRNYSLFGLLAGVRGWMDPLIEPRGLPSNLSEGVEKEERWWEQSYHTPTWYDLSELYLYRKMYKSYIRKDESLQEEERAEAYGSFVYFVDCIEHYLDLAQEWTWGDIAPSKYRVIMWFDS